MISIAGAIDCHVHAGPEIFPRKGDAIDVALRARDAGMAGMVFKAHHESTVTRALLASKVVDGIELWGALTLNRYVGGLNPIAVQAALDSGAKVIWMPTVHAAGHIAEFGAPTYGIASMTLSDAAASVGAGMSILNENDQPIPELHQIVRLAAAKDAVIATGHLTLYETQRLVELCVTAEAQVVVTHAMYLPRTTVDEVAALAAAGAYIELCANAAYPIAWYQEHGMSLGDAKRVFEAVGAEKIIVSSDAGQPFAPWPNDILETFAISLAEVGVPEDWLHQSLVDTPKQMLGLDGARPARGRPVAQAARQGVLDDPAGREDLQRDHEGGAFVVSATEGRGAPASDAGHSS